MYVHDRGAKQVHTVLVPGPQVEAIETAARLSPVADTNHALVSELSNYNYLPTKNLNGL